MTINWDKDQLSILEKLTFEFDLLSDLNDEQILEVDEKITDYFQLNCLDNVGVNTEGIICEGIIDLIAELG